MGNQMSEGGNGGKTKIVLAGPTDSGKSSLMCYLNACKRKDIKLIMPMEYIFAQTLSTQDATIVSWDFGASRSRSRPTFLEYFKSAKIAGFVYMIDSFRAKEDHYLDHMLDEIIEYLLLDDLPNNAVIMILANKQDELGAMPAKELEDALLERFTFSTASTQTVFVLPCSVLKSQGVDEAFAFFSEQIRLKAEGQAPPGLVPTDRVKEMIKALKEEKKREASNETTKKPEVLKIKQFMKNPLRCVKAVFNKG